MICSDRKTDLVQLAMYMCSLLVYLKDINNTTLNKHY